MTMRPGRMSGRQLVPDDAAGVEIGAQERHRMRLQRQMQVPVVLDHLLARQHRRQAARPARAPAMAARANSGRSSLSPARCSALTAHSASRRLKPSERKASASRELFQRGGIQPRAQPEVAHGIEAFAADAFDDLGIVFRKAADLPEAEPQRMRRVDIVSHAGMATDASRPTGLGSSSSVQSQSDNSRPPAAPRRHAPAHRARSATAHRSPSAGC